MLHLNGFISNVLLLLALLSRIRDNYFSGLQRPEYATLLSPSQSFCFLYLDCFALEMGYLYLYTNILDPGGQEAQSRLPEPTRPLMGHCTVRGAGILLVVPILDIVQLALLRFSAAGRGDLSSCPLSGVASSAGKQRSASQATFGIDMMSKVLAVCAAW